MVVEFRPHDVAGQDAPGGASGAVDDPFGIARDDAQHCLAAGEVDEALRLLQAFAEDHPGDANGQNEIGVVLAGLGRHADAVPWFRRAVALRPGLITARLNLGDALFEHRQFEEAVTVFEALSHLRPDDADLCHKLGRSLKSAERRADAAVWLRKAFTLQPTEVNYATELGGVLRALEQNDAAITVYRDALALDPASSDAAFGLGSLLQDRRQFEDAAALFQGIVDRQADHLHAWLSLGAALLGARRHAEALSAYRRALVLQPGSAVAFCNMSLALFGVGRLEEGVKACDKALVIEPGSPVANFNRGCIRLAQGHFREGWQGYDHRFGLGSNGWLLEDAHAAPWTGEDVAGKSFLVIGEQGNGDQIHFARYLPALAALGASVTYLVPARLFRLFESMPGDIALIHELPPHARFDFQGALMSLPRWFEQMGRPIPNAPYLAAEPDRMARWADRIGPHGYRIGIIWQGNIYPNGDFRRSYSPEHLRPLARLPNVRLISLQLGDGAQQLDRLSADIPVERLDADFDTGEHGFLDSAAVMRSVDLVVSCDTSMAHLAGALGVPVWIALNDDPEWRWQRSGSDTIWYPTARLFRQGGSGDWDDVFQTMAQVLAKTLQDSATLVGSARATSAPPPIEVSWGELFDKISILEIKAERLSDPDAAANVRRETQQLTALAAKAAPFTADLTERRRQLRVINETLWDIEDRIRSHEANKQFDEQFIQLARSVYQWNDRRAALKREINTSTNSRFVEEKQYSSY